ncbi:hypothetical protein M758_9G007800 [Ceratodon purpureus]|uniref:Phytocyanin domain-containing protein n=1 Tax=Ceratodon purpureus TaxID=3225 RepID=A0A8T0GQ62_CERPU|nr:hypothetical protein KC19_9G008200 [Ceratodon purpureus]KAG0604789.1 hypothetical protein M758_9G007800 [Ceratodon purpureus]
MGRGSRNSKDAAVLMIALIATAVQDVAVATEYTVGNATGWDFAPTTTYYDDWASGLKFVPGDKLVFKYLPIAHNVQEVNETDYKTCNSLNPIAEYESGNDIITLAKPGTRYYICGFLGHCDQGGMRMKTTIVDQVSSTPLIPVIPPTNSELPSPMTSIIPQLPSPAAGNGTTSNPPPHSSPHGHAHPPTAAPVSVPGHSAGDPTVQVPRLLVAISLGVASAAVSLLFW